MGSRGKLRISTDCAILQSGKGWSFVSLLSLALSVQRLLEFQAAGEVESIASIGPTKGPSDKTIESVSQLPLIVRNLLNPAFNKTNSEATLESFDGQHLKVGLDTTLIMGGWILRIEIRVPRDRGFFLLTSHPRHCHRRHR